MEQNLLKSSDESNINQAFSEISTELDQRDQKANTVDSIKCEEVKVVDDHIDQLDEECLEIEKYEGKVEFSNDDNTPNEEEEESPDDSCLARPPKSSNRFEDDDDAPDYGEEEIDCDAQPMYIGQKNSGNKFEEGEASPKYDKDAVPPRYDDDAPPEYEEDAVPPYFALQRGEQDYDELSNEIGYTFTLNFADDEEITPCTKKNETTKEEKFNLEDQFKLNIKLKHNQLQLNTASSITLPLLITLDIDSINTTNKASIDIICVIDHSGSMEGDKLELLKNTFNDLLELLDDNDRLSIVIFDDAAKRLTPLLKMTEVNKKKTIEELFLVQADGGTDINKGVKYALEVLRQRRYKNSVTSILVLSDGLDSGAENKIKKTLKDMNIEDTFTINTFGYGSDHDPKLMSDIAQLKNGSFYFVEKLETVDECFVDCLGGLISVVGEDANISIRAEPSNIFPNIKLVKAYGVAGTWTQINDTYMTRIPQLISGKKKNYLLEIQIPKAIGEVNDNNRNIKIASTECIVKDLSTNNLVIKKSDLVITFLNETEEIKENEIDKDVMFNYYRVRGAEIINEARKLSDISEYEKAKQLLQNFKEDLVNSILKEDETMKNLIKDIDIAINNVNPEKYEVSGKHYMIQNYNAQMEEKSNLCSNVVYSNAIQSEMVFKAKSKKGPCHYYIE